MVVFPHMANHQVDDLVFIAAWKVYVAHQFPNEQGWQNFCMPRYNAAVGFDQIQPGLDKLCRMLAPRPDTMQASNAFINQNQHAVVACMAEGLRGQVNGARLTGTLVAAWNEQAPEAQEQLEREAESIMAADFDDPEVEPVPPARANQAQAAAAAIGIANVAARTMLVEALVREIHNEPFQAHYRGAPHGHPVLGWANRLSAYFWPKPTVGPMETSAILDRLLETLLPAAQAVSADVALAADLEQGAVTAARQLLTWGGVPQRQFSAATVRAVLNAAITGNVGDAPMNSGWTKLAALSSQVRPQNEQAIWDSRVSASVVTRLDAVIARNGGDPATLFPGLAPVRAFRTAGPRRQLLNHLAANWPHGYRSWAAHFAGGDLVREMVAVLNAHPGQYGRMPPRRRGDAAGEWDVRGVEMVLFMDGY